MIQNYKALLVNMPVRHTLAMMELDPAALQHQFSRLVTDMDITNFFILAR